MATHQGQLSVSSVGSEAMQPSPNGDSFFSSVSLSVSSVGSEAMQLRPEAGADPLLAPFQYPRSDRRRCNPGKPPAPSGSGRLSVSSVGSEAMQPRRTAAAQRTPPQLSVSSVGSEAMQLPMAPYIWSTPSGFQYPRSDRRRCNHHRGNRQADCARPFSILGRIGGDATISPSSHRRCRVHLSVSSVGSEAMQLRW